MNIRIQWIRAVAIAGVLLLHFNLFGFSGGFLGVDIFFVISGYLITKSILREYSRNISIGKESQYFSLFRFFERRLKRIFPLAITVAIFIEFFNVFFLSQSYSGKASIDLVYVLSFLVNFHFIAQQTNYFISSDYISYFQHYWSLAVEEQFYLAYAPFVIYILKKHNLKIFGKVFNWRSRLFLAVGFIGVTSFFLYAILYYRFSTFGFFFTPARLWEFGIGSIFAIRMNWIATKLFAVRNYIGTAFFFVTFIIYQTTDFDSKITPLVTVTELLLTAMYLVVCDSFERRRRVKWNLPANLISFVGDISYSIYLWHWPIYCASVFFLGGKDLGIKQGLLMVFLTLILSIFSRKYIELPFMRLSISEKNMTRFTRKLEYSMADLFSISIRRRILIAISLLGIVFNFLFLHSMSKGDYEGLSSRVPPEPTGMNIVDAPIDTSSVSVGVDAWKLKIVQASSIKSLTIQEQQASKNLMSARDALWSRPCPNSVSQKFHSCASTSESRTKTMVLLGDSFLEAFDSSFLSNFDLSQWKIVNLWFGQCTFANLTPDVADEAKSTECNKNRNAIFDYLSSNPPTQVFIAENWNTPIKGISEDNPKAKILFQSHALQESLKRLPPQTRVYYFGSIPSYFSIQSCTSSNGTLRPQCFGKPIDSANQVKAQNEVIRASGGKYLDATQLLCANLTCPPIIDGHFVTYDGAHLTTELVNAVWPSIRKIFGESFSK